MAAFLVLAAICVAAYIFGRAVVGTVLMCLAVGAVLIAVRQDNRPAPAAEVRVLDKACFRDMFRPPPGGSGYDPTNPSWVAEARILCTVPPSWIKAHPASNKTWQEVWLRD